MTKSVNYQFQMHDRVLSVCNQNVSLLSLIVAYLAVKLNLDKSIAVEKDLAEKKESFRTTSVIPRNVARLAATTFLLELSSKIMSFALGKNNMTLYIDAKLTKTAIDKVPDQEFVIIFNKILKLAEDNLIDLADYLVTDDTITDGEKVLQNLLDEMQVLIDRKSAYKEYTLELNKQIKITNGILKTIDSMVNSMKQSQPNLYSKYWDARGIKKSGGSKLVFKCRAFDSVTGQPLPGTMVTLTPVEGSKSLTSGADLVKTVKIKSAGGGLQLKSVPVGDYIVTAAYYGYDELQVNISVNDYALTSIDLPLTKKA